MKVLKAVFTYLLYSGSTADSNHVSLGGGIINAYSNFVF